MARFKPMTAEARLEALENILRSYTENYEQRKDAEGFIKVNRVDNGFSNKERVLVGAIYDGLAYGNWPWTIMPRPD